MAIFSATFSGPRRATPERNTSGRACHDGLARVSTRPWWPASMQHPRCTDDVGGPGSRDRPAGRENVNRDEEPPCARNGVGLSGDARFPKGALENTCRRGNRKCYRPSNSFSAERPGSGLMREWTLSCWPRPSLFMTRPFYLSLQQAYDDARQEIGVGMRSSTRVRLGHRSSPLELIRRGPLRQRERQLGPRSHR